jgi:hypothetical protein
MPISTKPAVRHPANDDIDRKEPKMLAYDRIVLALVQEHQARLRDDAQARRRVRPRNRRSFRRRLGESLMRLGERLAAEPSARAWTG